MFLSSYARAHARLAAINSSCSLKCPVCNFEHREVSHLIGNFQPQTQHACSHGCRVVFMKIECPICIETLEPPVVAFPCGHGVCKPCFEQLGGRTGETANRARGRNVERSTDHGLGSFSEDDEGFLRRVRAARASLGNLANRPAENAGIQRVRFGPIHPMLQEREGEAAGSRDYQEGLHFRRQEEAHLEAYRARMEERATRSSSANNRMDVDSGRYLIRAPHYDNLRHYNGREGRPGQLGLEAFRTSRTNGNNANQGNAGSSPSNGHPDNQGSDSGNNRSRSDRFSRLVSRSRSLSPDLHSRIGRIRRARRALNSHAAEMRARPLFARHESTSEDSNPGISSSRRAQARRQEMSQYFRSRNFGTGDNLLASESTRSSQSSNDDSSGNVAVQDQESHANDNDESSESSDSSESIDELLLPPPRIVHPMTYQPVELPARFDNSSSSSADDAVANHDDEENGDEEINEENESGDDEEDVVLAFLRRQRERRNALRNRLISRNGGSFPSHPNGFRFNRVSNAELVRHADLVRRQSGRANNGDRSGARLSTFVARSLRNLARTRSNRDTNSETRAEGMLLPVPIRLYNDNNGLEGISVDDSGDEQIFLGTSQASVRQHTRNRTVRFSDGTRPVVANQRSWNQEASQNQGSAINSSSDEESGHESSFSIFNVARRAASLFGSPQQRKRRRH